MTNFSNKPRKLYFWSIFPIFEAKILFSNKYDSVIDNTTWATNNTEFQKRTDDPIVKIRKPRNRRKDRPN